MEITIKNIKCEISELAESMENWKVRFPDGQTYLFLCKKDMVEFAEEEFEYLDLEELDVLWKDKESTNSYEIMGGLRMLEDICKSERMES